MGKQLPKIFSPNQPTGKVILWQFNNIYQLHEVSFRNLLQLAYLDLSNNRIEIIYLDEIPAGSIGMGLIDLIVSKENQAHIIG